MRIGLASPKAPLVKHNNVIVNTAFLYAYVFCVSRALVWLFFSVLFLFFPPKQYKRLNKTGSSQGIISSSRMLVMRTIRLIQFSFKANECPSLSTHSQSL